MNHVTISSSLKYKDKIQFVLGELEKIGVVGDFPNIDWTPSLDKQYLQNLKKLEDDHFQAIDRSDCLYVICPSGKAGVSVSVEIGYAKAKGIPIIFSETPTDEALQAIAFQYIPLNEIGKIVNI